MARDGDRLQGLSVRVGIVEGYITTIKSTLDSVIQELDQTLADGTY